MTSLNVLTDFSLSASLLYSLGSNEDSFFCAAGSEGLASPGNKPPCLFAVCEDVIKEVDAPLLADTLPAYCLTAPMPPHAQSPSVQ